MLESGHSNLVSKQLNRPSQLFAMFALPRLVFTEFLVTRAISNLPHRRHAAA